MKLTQAKNKLNELKNNFSLPDADINQLQADVSALQDKAQFFRSKSFKANLNQFAAVLKGSVEAVSPVTVASPLLIRAATPEEQFEMSQDVAFRAICGDQAEIKKWTSYADALKVEEKESPDASSEAPQEERTYVQAILDVLQAFYQIVRDAISFMVSTCSKAVEQASAYVSSSMFASPDIQESAEESAQKFSV